VGFILAEFEELGYGGEMYPWTNIPRLSCGIPDGR